MNSLASRADERVKTVDITKETICVSLMDGRTISAPLAWFPKLEQATPGQREQWELCGGGYGIHWEELDEDLSTEGLLRGAPAPQPNSEPSQISCMRP
ncbi:MAG: DUF2442 domain-containing protein [Magnetococcus sp. YQC-5]